MPDWWPALLLGVFAVHLPIFARRWWIGRAPRHAATTLTFALLVAAYAARVFAPQLAVAGVALHAALRGVALAAAAVSIGMLLHHALSARRGPS